MAQRPSTAMERGLGTAGRFVAINNHVSQSVAHLHTHVVPRNRKDSLRGFVWPRTKYGSDAEAEDYAGAPPWRAGVSPRLRFTLDAHGRLTIGARARRVVGLCLLPEGLQLEAAATEPVVLPWSDQGGVGWVTDGPPLDRWMVTDWGRNAVGVAVLVSGKHEAACAALLDATIDPWRRFNQWVMSGTETGRRLPVLPLGSLMRAADRERGTLSALHAAARGA